MNSQLVSVWRLLSVLLLLAGLPATAEEYFERYDIKTSAEFVDLGVQPNAYPLAFISSSMRRDKYLQEDLTKLRVGLRTHAFKKGNDIYRLLGEAKLEMAFVGDMPTVNAIVNTSTVVIGLGKRNFSSIVSRAYARLEELRGKKLGYSAGSSSHLVLLRGLKAAGMTEKDVELVALEPAQMPDALEAGTVDAYSAWEPTPSISLQRNPKNRAIYRGMSTDWVIFSRDFAERQPEVALALVASYVRSINWMRKSAENLRRATQWVLADGERFTGKPTALSIDKAMDIARKDLLDVPGAPSVPSLVDGVPPLTRELAFLKDQGKIPPAFNEDGLRKAFDYDGLKTVQADPKRYRLFRFNFAD